MKKLQYTGLFLLLFYWGKSQNLTDLPILAEPSLSTKTQAQIGQIESQTLLFATIDEALDATFDSIFLLSGLVGISAAVNLPDGRTWTRSGGTNVDFPTTQLMPDDPLGIGSITKTMIATLMLKAQESNLLDLDDKISEYLDPIQHVNNDITIRQLLNHTSGLGNYSDNPMFSAAIDLDITRTWAQSEILTFIPAPTTPPGQGWSYSNTNFVLAGMILEKVHEKKLEILIKETITNPLQLQNTFLMPQESAPNNEIAHVWADITNDGIADDIHLLVPNIDAFFSSAWAAGAVVSTPSDISIFIKALFGSNLLTNSSLAEMQDFVLLDLGLGLGYGLGALRIQDPAVGKVSWGHNGYIIYQSEANYLSDLDLSVAVQSNDGTIDTDQSVLDVYRALVIRYCAYLMSPTNEVFRPKTINIYPNPTQSRIFAPDFAESYLIFNHSGKLVLEGTCSKDSAIEIEALPSGVFSILFRGTELQMGRFVKQ